jgi:hypothetical protein
MSREHLTRMRREAMEILDMVRAGIAVPESRVIWALITTGDLTLTDIV